MKQKKEIFKSVNSLQKNVNCYYFFKVYLVFYDIIKLDWSRKYEDKTNN